MKNMIIAPALTPGDKVAVLTSASHVDEAKWQRAIENVKSFGLEPYFTELTNRQYGYLAGKDEDRAIDFNLAVQNQDVKAIWMVRGGYGTARMVDYIDYQNLKKNPKRIIGFSDQTFLHHAIWKNTGLVSYHGAMAGSELDAFSRQQIANTFFMSEFPEINLPFSGSDAIEVMNPAVTSGVLLGGNLSLINTLIGTKYDTDWTNAIVFIEEVGEKPYRIDRMLNQLKQSGKLAQSKAFVLGKFEQCEAKDWNLSRDNSLELDEIFDYYFASLKVPLIKGFPIGHIATQHVLPFGAAVLLRAEKKFISLSAQSNLI